MRRRTAILGAALLLSSGAMGVAATPAQAQPHVDCSPLLTIPCGVVNRALWTAIDELQRVPGYVDEVRNIVLPIYDKVTGTVRCVISGECP